MTKKEGEKENMTKAEKQYISKKNKNFRKGDYIGKMIAIIMIFLLEFGKASIDSTKTKNSKKKKPKKKNKTNKTKQIND